MQVHCVYTIKLWVCEPMCVCVCVCEWGYHLQSQLGLLILIVHVCNVWLYAGTSKYFSALLLAFHSVWAVAVATTTTTTNECDGRRWVAKSSWSMPSSRQMNCSLKAYKENKKGKHLYRITMVNMVYSLKYFCVVLLYTVDTNSLPTESFGAFGSIVHCTVNAQTAINTSFNINIRS